MVIDTPNKTVTSDGTDTDSQAAVTYIDGLNVDGWTLIIGDSSGGPYTWASAVNMAATFVHSVIIQGGGGVNNKTRIIADFDSSGQALGIRATPGKTTKVQYFTFVVASGRTLGSGFIDVDQTSTSDASNSFWIENCDFENCSSLAMSVLGPNRANAGAVYGLIDLCNFNTVSNANNGLYFYAGNNGNQWGNTSRSGTNGVMTWGTVNTICVEDCNFTFSGNTVPGKPAIDSAFNGVRWLARHNTFRNWVSVAHGADTAPTSTLQVENLHNTTILTGSAVDYIMYIRGGTMRYWDNTVTLIGGTTINQVIKTANDSPVTGGFESFEQVGHGVTGASGIVGSQNYETYVPVYAWGNTVPAVTLFNPASGIVSGVHYFLQDPGNYVELQYPHPLRANLKTIKRLGRHVKIIGWAYV